MTNKTNKKHNKKLNYTYSHKGKDYILGVDLVKDDSCDKSVEVEYYLNVPYLNRLTREED